MMRFKEFNINEAPLPPDWDKEVYSPRNSYKKRIDYTVARAQKLGKGSSRTAFIIDHEGRQTILKVAHNHKGSIQNSEEVDILNDGYIQQMGIAIPIIDYDHEHPEPTWIHTEMAQKVSANTLCKIMKTPNLYTLSNYAKLQLHNSGSSLSRLDAEVRKFNKDNEDSMETFHEYVNMLAELENSFNLNLNDFTRAANWGLYNGHPVIIDLGFTTESAKLYR